MVAIAALTPEKGIDLLLRAAAELHRAWGNVRWIVLGGRPGTRPTGSGSDRPGLEHVVEFAGFVAEPERVLAGATIAVQPSRQEGFGMAVLMAMARGVPVVATGVGGLTEALSAGGGVLVRRDDPAALAAAIARLLGDAAERARIGTAGIEAARHFGVDRMVERTSSPCIVPSCARTGRHDLLLHPGTRRGADRRFGAWKIRRVLGDVSREYQLLVGDDASSDTTAEVLEPYTRVLPLSVLRSEERVGYAATVQRLLEEALRRSDRHKRDVAVLFPADFAADPADLPEFLKRLDSGADLVVGEAVLDREPDRWRRWARRLAPRVLGRKVRVGGVRDIVSGVVAFRLVTLRNAFGDTATRWLAADGFRPRTPN